MYIKEQIGTNQGYKKKILDPCHRSDAPAMCWMHTCTGGTQPVAITRCHIETERRQNSLIMCNIY